MARSRSAWWPGGRRPQKANPPSTDSRSVAWTAPPAEWRAASKEPALATVSTSIMPPPCAEIASMESTWAALWTRSSCARLAAGASTSSRPSQSRSDIASSIAVSLLAFSGCPPVSCRNELGCRR